MTSVLFLCDDNAAVSVMAESILRSMGPRFASYSAGIQPAAEVDAGVIEFLRERHLPTAGLRAKDIGSAAVMLTLAGAGLTWLLILLG